MHTKDIDRPFKPGDVSEEDIREELLQMESNPQLNTKSGFIRDDALQIMTFQEKHLSYLREHPKVNPIPYLANLKTMIKIRK